MSVRVSVRGVSVRYGNIQALDGVSLDAPERSICALIGPSGCGKTTLLRSINRLNDHIPGFRLTGEISVGGESVYALKSAKRVRQLRAGIGMIFQKPNPLPMTVMQNMLFPYKEHARAAPGEAEELAVRNLRRAGLYEELDGRLNIQAARLSGGQQQRLCIARALMLDTGLLLLDEPCSALDPISTARIEELLRELRNTHTVIMVTHSLEQARRLSDITAFLRGGRLIESGATETLFSAPAEELTAAYIREG